MAGKGRGSPAIGMDLGMTYSCVAVWKHDRVEIITNDQGNRITPSCVAFTDEQRLIGEGAMNQIARNPANTVFVQDNMKFWPFKVIKGPNDMPKIVVTYKGHEKQFTAEEISAMVLTKMKEVAEAYIGETVKNAVITVPAYFNDCQRQSTKDAANIAGLNVLRMINEPTAAAIAYGVDNSSWLTGKRNVVVFDLGGGTFDVSVLTIEEGGTFEVKAVAGNTHLGGEDFNNCMVNYCVGEFKNRFNRDVTGNERAMGRLKVACEKAKKMLSYASHASFELEVFHEGIDFFLKFTRAKFDELNIYHFTECIKKLQTCLTDAKMDKKSVDEVILVGGSTRIPKVRDMLQEFFDGKQLCKGINPDEAVAYGAAVVAAKLSDAPMKMVKELVLLDVTPLSLGVGIIGNLMSVVVPRNTPIPTKKTKNLVTVKDNQSSMDFVVYQGERTKSTDNYQLGKLNIYGIPLAPKGISKVSNSFEIDANGILTVTSMVVDTGKTEKLTVTNHSGRLSKQEIEKMVEDAEKFKIEDQQYKRKAEACNGLEDHLYVLKTKLKSNDIPPEVLKNVEYAIDDTTKWLSNNKDATTADIEAKKKFMEFMFKLSSSK